MEIIIKPIDSARESSPLLDRCALLKTLSEGEFIETPIELGRWALVITELCSANDKTLNKFRAWLTTVAPDWVKRKLASMAGVIEAAARLDIYEAIPLISKILSDFSYPQIACSVAAQRIRLFSINNYPFTTTMASNLNKHIKIWEEAGNLESVLMALPSLAALWVKSKDLVSILDWIEHPNNEIMISAVYGLKRLSRTALSSISSDTLEVIFNVLYARLNAYLNEQDSKRYTPSTSVLLEASVLFCPDKEIDNVVDSMLIMFMRSNPIQQAYAVAGACAFTKKWGLQRFESVLSKANVDTPTKARLLKLIASPSSSKT